MKPHKGTTMEPMGILRFRTLGFEVMLGRAEAFRDGGVSEI